MFVLDRMLVGSIRFVLDKLVSAAEAEMNDEEGLRERLLEAQMQLELGEMSEEEFAAVERDVLAAMREIRARRDGADDASVALGDGVTVVGATAEIAGEMHRETGSGAEAAPDSAVRPRRRKRSGPAGTPKNRRRR